MVENMDLQTPLRVYCDPDSNIQAQVHIKPFHFYSAIRLVLEGGFVPEGIFPHPPFVVEELKLHDPQDVGQFTYQPRLWQD